MEPGAGPATPGVAGRRPDPAAEEAARAAWLFALLVPPAPPPADAALLLLAAERRLLLLPPEEPPRLDHPGVKRLCLDFRVGQGFQERHYSTITI